MRHVKLVGLCLAAVFALSGLAAGQALAQPEFAWHVGGNVFGSGSETELQSSAKTNQVLKATVLGIKVEITCTTVATPGAEIIGGVPGTSSETVHYTHCTVQKPSGCKIKEEKITTNPLTDEIVEGVGASAGKPLILFRPTSGNVFAEPKLSGFFCLSVPVEGTVLAEPIPDEEEGTSGALKFEPAESKHYKNSAGEEKSAGLSNSGTVSGEVEVSLVSGESFGVF
jgi:hypothetical protein